MLDKPEVRTYAAELRVNAPSYGKKTPSISGYAARFNVLSETMPIYDNGELIGTFREQLLPGCFATALGTSDVRALINHDPNLILGRNVSGTLRMLEDEIGLSFENDPPETSYSKDIQVSIQRRDISQCSFGFRVAPGGDKWEKDPSVPGGYIRSISQMAQIFDVSVVTYPAYVDTDCAVRSIVGKMKEDEEASKALKSSEEEAERVRVAEVRRKQLELIERSLPVDSEVRVNMGYCDYNRVGVCKMTGEEGCLCKDCDNQSYSNMHTSDDGGCCTKCLAPGCKCLGCEHTDKCTAKQMYSM